MSDSCSNSLIEKDKRNKPIKFQRGQQYHSLIALWTLRILVNARGYKKFLNNSHMLDESILEAIGLGHLGDGEFNSKEMIVALRQRAREVEASGPVASKGTLLDNLAWLGETLSLAPVEAKILQFLCMLKNWRCLEDAIDLLGDINLGQSQKVVATVVQLPLSQVQRVLSHKSTLIASGLVKIEGQGVDNLYRKLEMMEGLLDVLSRKHKEPSQMLDYFFAKSPATSLGLKDFPHVNADIGFIKGYLNGLKQKSAKGCNVLLYGQPGTGKTELVRALAQELRFVLHEIAVEDLTGEAQEGQNRIMIYQFAQRLLGRKKHAAILFDEIEDVFPTSRFGFIFQDSKKGQKKAWLNRLLEENPVPAFWVCNDIYQIDSAFIRRFDYVLELPVPSQSVRKNILEKYLGNQNLSRSWIDRMASHESIAPGLVARVAKVTKRFGKTAPAEKEQMIERIIGNSLVAMDLPRKPRNVITNVARYSLDYLNPDYDLSAVITGLKEGGHGRFCLYGPPGTGKSAFAQYLAEQIKRPLIKKRASDLLSCWVGENEKNISRMFQQAEDDNAVILLDEADTFLQERSRASSNWQISSVNELLVQMETFENIFIASTNLMDTLDAASLRRFDLKIKFDYLGPKQAELLFIQVLNEHGQHKSAEIKKYLARLQMFDNITPGDFAVVIRQYSITRQSITPESLARGLEAESRMKPGTQRNRIGF